ncbi:sensor histidine kinase [Saccharospirillum salsuginis]|uniref:histidine kinase n=1 Tax=Saccharospirillum salsuginis TaxID=418750 RepID=A0A918NA91_9GAMM|nr:ATP-binding protein [Saccharospirillum salsuginis]GGX57947.1 histidine kinase [Saccharospirillum salsuginis]
MAFSRFSIRVFIRALLMAATVTGLGMALLTPGYYAVTGLLVLVIAGQLIELNHFVGRTHTDLMHFLEALRSGDFSQRYLDNDRGFAPLARQFRSVLATIEDNRTEQESRLRYMTALTEQSPVPLISVLGDGQVRLHNLAARRLFGQGAINHLDDLIAYGAEFHDAVNTLEPGQRRLVRFNDDGVERQLAILASRIVSGDRVETLVSLQDIQGELDANQLQTWHELVRVLTHEIMNSLTPVASLAKTASELMSDLRQSGQAPPEAAESDFEDACQAVDTVARRADGMMQFIQSYRTLTQLPKPRQKTIRVSELFKRVHALLAHAGLSDALSFTTCIEPDTLQLTVDPDLLEQVLINLLTNAAQATEHLTDPEVRLSAAVTHRGRVVLAVDDNGPGIPDAITDRIFVPFFTTKRGGSGVGLALARQIMIAHGGRLSVSQSNLGGARFTLFF